ncbi:hypothetical protein HWV62_30873 [Athelia sp. TMB]|nr:hypothetical protein HWV62_30873 [Athelia sp. TMB]
MYSFCPGSHQRIDVCQAFMSNIEDRQPRVAPPSDDAQAIDSQHNALRNLHTPISILPDDLLRMIFEVGTCRDNDAFRCFGELVSHVSQRWRSIALATPLLWRFIRYNYRKTSINRINAYLSRAKLAPLDIRLDLGMFIFPPMALLKMASEHMGHCHRLCIVAPRQNMWIHISHNSAEETSPRPASALRTYKLIGVPLSHLSRPLVPFVAGAPNLKMMHLDRPVLDAFQSYPPAFDSVTHMRLTGISITTNTNFNSICGFLGAMRSLSHLELGIDTLSHILPHQSPITLSTVQFLSVPLWILGNPLLLIDAPCSTTVALSGEGQTAGRTAPVEFPLVRHLMITRYAAFVLLEDFDWLAQTFRHIERFTIRLDNHRELEDIIAAFDHHHACQWLKLQCIAFDLHEDLSLFSAAHLCEFIARLRQTGYPLRTLLIPKVFVSREALCYMSKETGEQFEIADLPNEDWPMSMKS